MNVRARSLWLGVAAAPLGASTPASAAPGSSARAASCVERLPSGRSRPPVEERFPERGTAGHVAELVVAIEHLPGERVLPGDLRVEASSLDAQRLERAHFILPDARSAPPRLEREEGDQPRTTLTVPLVPLPPDAGRHELVLPSIPIAMARASGEVFVLCTQEHTITVEDPLTNHPDAPPEPNPEPRRQLEVWATAKEAFLFGAAALVLAALLAWLFTWWRRRPRATPAPPPPRVPWEVAEEALYDLERAGLVAAGRFDEHFERVADVIREYLGRRYGFDGLECTSRETLRVLRAITPPIAYLPQIKSFLQQADLVKFARLTPSAEECADFLERARTIVQRTIPSYDPSARSSDGAANTSPTSHEASETPEPPEEGGRR